MESPLKLKHWIICQTVNIIQVKKIYLALVTQPKIMLIQGVPEDLTNEETFVLLYILIKQTYNQKNQ